jgi:hypothetical protein
VQIILIFFSTVNVLFFFNFFLSFSSSTRLNAKHPSVNFVLIPIQGRSQVFVFNYESLRSIIHSYPLPIRFFFFFCDSLVLCIISNYLCIYLIIYYLHLFLKPFFFSFFSQELKGYSYTLK